MYYSGNIIDFLNKNTAIIGEKRSGKTTILKKIIKYCYDDGYTILLFDTATSNKKKSILVNTRRKYKSNIVISSPSEKDISFNVMSNILFPHNIVRKSNFRIYSFDVSKYFDIGNDTGDSQKRKAVQVFYKQLVFQELVVMLNIVNRRKTIVLMDEIEFIPIMRSAIARCNVFNIPVIVTAIDENDLSTSISLFNIVSLD